MEDVLVEPRGARQIDTVSPLGPFLRNRVKVWEGVPFEGKLMRTDSGTGYVPSEGPFPSCSTGYWLPEQTLVFDGDGRYVFRVDGGRRRIRYVGVADPVHRIGTGTLGPGVPRQAMVAPQRARRTVLADLGLVRRAVEGDRHRRH